VARIVDYGDIVWGGMPWLEKTWHEKTVATVTKILEAGAAPLMCGGDHTIAVPMIRALGAFHDEPLACIHFDAHHDHFPFDDRGLHSGALMWAAINEGWVDPGATIGLGYRGAFNWKHKDDFDFLWGHDLVRLGPTAVAKIVREKVGDKPVWLTFDIDGMSSETIDGTSTLVPGGPNFHFVQGLLYNLQGINLVGADLSELNPNTAGQSTLQATATAMVYFATLMAIAKGRAPAVIEHDFG
jgi:agmatinase